MIAYQVQSGHNIDAVKKIELPDPKPGAREVVIELKAASLNYRDLMIVRGGYPRNATRPVIPLSDGAGIVVAVGKEVTEWKTGDRVTPAFMRDWLGGAPTEQAFNSSLGGGVNGVLAERFVASADAMVRIPDHLDFAEAATLPCAAVTAWHALTASGTTAGDTALMLGTGGVSIFGVQLAKALGAVPIITSSSDDKLNKARELGAAYTVNYRTYPEWHEQVMAITDGRGVDCVLETGGPGTLERSIKSVALGGSINLIGVLAEGTPPNLIPAMLQGAVIRGIYVGSVQMFEAMNRAITAHKIKPVIHARFPFAEAIEAYKAFEQQNHVGKVVIVRD